MKFKWQYRYVPDGQLKPDNHNRWAIDCFVYADVQKSLPEYKWIIGKSGMFRKYMPVRVATMTQQGCLPGCVPSLVNKFCVTMPSFDGAGNIGMSTEHNYFSNDIDELKKIVEANFRNIQKVFKYLN